jgi:hypothetical protein
MRRQFGFEAQRLNLSAELFPELRPKFLLR